MILNVRRVVCISLFMTIFTCSQVYARSGWPLVSGSNLGAANGIRVVDDTLVIASAVGGKVTVLDRWTGQTTAVFGRDAGVFGPDDLAIGSDGSIYITEFFTGTVSRLNVEGGNATPVAQIGPGANAIAISPDGRMFASKIFLGDALYEIDLNGAPPRLVAENLQGLNGFDFGPDGMIYGPQWFAGTVVQVDPEDGSVEVLFEGFNSPAAVKFGPDGALYAIDQDPGRVWRLDLASGTKTLVADVGEGADNLDFGSYWGVSIIYVTNAHNGSVQAIVPDWGLVFPLVQGGMSMAGGITTRGTDLIVADAQSLRTYDIFTGLQRSQEHAGIGGTGGLLTPQTVGNWKDKLVTTSWFSNTVQIWDPVDQSMLVTQRFTVPLNAIGFGDEVLVAELGAEVGSGCVTKWNPGTNVRTPVLCDLFVPSGLASDGHNAYVADQASGVIRQIIRDGQTLSPPRVVTTGLRAPEGITLAPGGDLLVYETGANRVVRLDIASGEIREVVLDELPANRPGIPGYPPTWLFNGIAVNDLGVVYVTTNGQNRVMATWLENH